MPLDCFYVKSVLGAMRAKSLLRPAPKLLRGVDAGVNHSGMAVLSDYTPRKEAGPFPNLPFFATI